MKTLDKQALEQYRAKLEAVRKGSLVNYYETPAEQRARIDSSVKDYKTFVTTYFAHYADSETADFQIRLAKRVRKNKTARELVRWGRGLAKSVHCCTLIPLWLWVSGESVYMVIVGNNETKAAKLLGDIQAEFEANPLLIHDFGEQVLQGSWSDGDFTTKDRRFRGVALGMGQSPRGLREGSQRPNLIVPDDLEDKDTSRNPKRQDDIVQWIERDLIPCMDGDTRRYVHPNNDPWPRSIQNLLEARHPKWHLDEVKAYDTATFAPTWHQKYSPSYYKDVEEDIGSLAARAEYNHEKHTEGKIFTDDMIQWAIPPRIDHFDLVVGFWDVAYSGKNDYNAVKVWGLKDNTFWLLKAFVKQCKMADAVKFMFDYEINKPAHRIQWRVESQFWNDPLRDAISTVEREQGRHLNLRIKDRPKANKYDRIISMHPYYQNGRIYYNIHEKPNNDMQVGIAQLKGIEPGYKTHDDSPDADEQALDDLSTFARAETAGNVRVRSKQSQRARSKQRY